MRFSYIQQLRFHTLTLHGRAPPEKQNSTENNSQRMKGPSDRLLLVEKCSNLILRKKLDLERQKNVSSPLEVQATTH